MPSIQELIQEANEPVNFSQAFWKRSVGELVRDELFTAAVESNNEYFRNHLGASVIGNACSRYIWYHWHWFLAEEHSGRVNRLFEYGHILETRIRTAMKARGATFLDTVDVDGKQIRVSALDGHYGGSVDGVFTWSEVGITEPMILECKSSQTGAPFSDLSKKGMMAAKNQHYIQNSTYGRYLNIPFALYVAENKNDSDLYCEVVELDFELAEQNEKKAFWIITDKTPPPRISNKPEFWLCKMCNMHPVCHGTEPIMPNCRNCTNCTPVVNAEFHCSLYNAVIPKEHLIKGCANHSPLPR